MEQSINPYRFRMRASALGLIMSNPKGGHPKDKLASLMEEISKAKQLNSKRVEEVKERLSKQIEDLQAKQEGADNKETKTYEKNAVKLEGLRLQQNSVLDFGKQYSDRLDKIRNLEEQIPGLKELASKPHLGETVKSYLSDWLKGSVWGREKKIRSKYLDKGNISEEDGVTLASINYGQFYVKNTRHFKDEYFKGTPDVVTYENSSLLAKHGDIEVWSIVLMAKLGIIATEIIDLKCSWDLSTFPMYDLKIKNKLYWWQLQCYMHLTGARTAKLCYALIDTPLELVLNEFKNAQWRKIGAIKELTDNEMYEIAKDMIYSAAEFEAIRTTHFPKSTLQTFVPIPEKNRLKTFVIEYDPQAMERAIDRVEECQQYIVEMMDNVDSNLEIAA